MIRIGSLFAGIGGLERGLLAAFSEAGLSPRVLWQVEFADYPRAVLARHFPESDRSVTDVRLASSANLAPVDLICGGYPCQPFSHAGQRGGATDPRHLWPEFARLLGDLRPRFALLENVAGHLSLGFREVLGDLAALGYDAEWTTLRASDVGAPHRRERLFCLAYAVRGGWPADGRREKRRTRASGVAGGGGQDVVADADRRAPKRSRGSRVVGGASTREGSATRPDDARMGNAALVLGSGSGDYPGSHGEGAGALPESGDAGGTRGPQRNGGGHCRRSGSRCCKAFRSIGRSSMALSPRPVARRLRAAAHLERRSPPSRKVKGARQLRRAAGGASRGTMGGPADSGRDAMSIDVSAIVRALSNPHEVADRLGLDVSRARRNGSGIKDVACPVHGGHALSLTRGASGLLAVHCFGCEFRGDVLGLVAAVKGLDVKRSFRDVLEAAAEIGRVDIRETADRMARPIAPPEPPRPPPPADEVRALWRACVPVVRDAEASAWLRSRGLDPSRVHNQGLAAALPRGYNGPGWAASARGAWGRSGYRVLIPLVDASGSLASVRARSCAAVAHDGPKALPPLGYGTKGLAMASRAAVRILRGKSGTLVVAEGEPDWLTWASRGVAALGIPGSGTWCADLARAIPDGTTVILRTDEDDAGDRYAAEIARDLRSRCRCLESGHAGREERRRTYEARRAARIAAHKEGRTLPDEPVRRDQNDLARAGLLPVDPAEGCE